jgi:hypothetical protein
MVIRWVEPLRDPTCTAPDAVLGLVKNSTYGASRAVAPGNSRTTS